MVSPSPHNVPQATVKSKRKKEAGELESAIRSNKKGHALPKKCLIKDKEDETRKQIGHSK